MKLLGWWCIALFALNLGSASAQAPSVNMSRDLVRLGIAATNLPPNDPTFDARPLFQAAVQYVRTNKVPLLTVDRGAYYFLTPQNTVSYLSLSGVSDLVVDLAGSTIYFKGAFLQGFVVTQSQRVTLTNFTTDFVNPPYTHVELTSVDAEGRKLLYKTLLGWVDPSTYSGTTTPFGAPELWAVVFRNGSIMPGTSRMAVRDPITSGILELLPANTPWTQSATLSTLRAGDVIVVTQRVGQPPVKAFFGDAITFSNITIHGSSSWAMELGDVSNSLVDRVRVMPRPGVGLIGSNGDGIHFKNVRQNNHVRNSYVTRTLDDGIAMDSLYVATLIQQTGARQLKVRRNILERFPNGTRINFVDPGTTRELTGATIVSQSPADSVTPTANGEVDLTFDADLPALPSEAGLAFATADNRGNGSTISDNIVAEVTFGRGIWITGGQGITVQRNSVGPTSNGGIVVSQNAISYPAPPSRDLVIANNSVIGSLGPMASGTGSQTATAAIIVHSIDSSGAFAQGSTNTNITIRSNFVADSGRAGIWIGELDGGTVQDNVIVRWNRRPELPYFGVSAQTRAMLEQDATQAYVSRFSANITVTNNTTSDTSTLAGAVTLDRLSTSVNAQSSAGTITVQSNVSGLTWSPISDAAWVSVAGAPLRTGAGNVEYTVAANTTPVSRRATIAIAGVTFSIAQDACPCALSTTSATYGPDGGIGTVTVTTTGACAWTAASSVSWIAVTSGASGTGNGSVTYSVSAATGASRTGILTIAGQAVTITERGPLATPPFGTIDTPAQGAQNVTGSIAITGWALDDAGVTAIRIMRDPVGAEPAGTRIFLGNAVLVTGARPDIAAGYPTLPFKDRAGWGYLLLTNMLPNQGNGPVTLYAYADDSDGFQTVLGSRTITCTNASATKPFGAIDTPGQGETISGTAYVNFGWALTPLPKTIPVDGSTVQVYIDGAPIGTATYNNYRADIAALFPGLANTNGAIGLRTIDTTRYANGVHTMSWVVADSAGVAEGIGSRYFTIQNGTASALADATPMLRPRMTAAPLSVTSRVGFDARAPWTSLADDAGDARRLAMPALSRLQIHVERLSNAFLRGDETSRRLPTGSSIDHGTEIFSWQPGPAFLGVYDLVLIATDERGLDRHVTIRLFIEPDPGGSAIEPVIASRKSATLGGSRCCSESQRCEAS